MSNILIIRLVIFIAGTLGILWVSWSALKKPGSHGTFRFLAWEAILLLFVMNFTYWFVAPWEWNQIISWILLIISLPTC